MSIRGYSYYQKGRLDALAVQVEKRENNVETKVAKNEYNIDIGNLNAKDAIHFTRINNLKQNKVLLADYTSKVDTMDDKDSEHNTKLNALDDGYGEKKSLLVFDNTIQELEALDENHDMRLDELEKRFSDIHIELYDNVIKELNLKINSDTFYDTINQISGNQESLSNEIANLLLVNEMEALNAHQDSLTATKADKAKFDSEIATIEKRHVDIEKRLLAIDQLFRLMARTYKIYNDDEDDEEIIYSANLLPVEAGNFFEFSSRKKNRIGITLTRFSYNTLINKISVLDNTNNEIGFATKNNFNAISLSGDIILGYDYPAFPLRVQYLNTGGDILFERSINYITYRNLNNPSAVEISYDTDIKYFEIGDNVEINPITWTGPIGVVEAYLPEGWSINNANGKITGVANTVESVIYSVTVKSQDGIESSTATIPIIVS